MQSRRSRKKSQNWKRIWLDLWQAKETGAAETCLLSSAHGLTPPGRWCEANQNSGFVISAANKHRKTQFMQDFGMSFKNTPTYSRPPRTEAGLVYDSRGNYGLANQAQDRQDYYLRRNLCRNLRRNLCRSLRRSAGC